MLQPRELRDLQVQTAEIVKKVGTFVLNSWNSIEEISFKDSRDIFTNVDVTAENMLREALKTLVPDSGIIVEEGKSNRERTYNWVIDPIDQTKNYVSQFPVFFVQIALLENDEPIVGHIYNPVADQLFSASKDNGAFLNDKLLPYVPPRELDASIINVDLGKYNEEYASNNMRVLGELYKQFFRLRIAGGMLPIYLVTGTIDAYIVLNVKTQIFDQAPRTIIIREAGYKADYVSINEHNFIVAGNDRNFAVIEEIIKNTYSEH